MLQYILKRSNANILPAVKNQTLPINETSMCACMYMYRMYACCSSITKKCRFVYRDNVLICTKRSDAIT